MMLYWHDRISYMGKDANKEYYSEQEIAQRRDDAVRRALNTPPKPHKDMKKGAKKKRQDDSPTASGDVKRD